MTQPKLVHSAVQSPQILELSGIGDKDILEPFGIPVKLHQPFVGTNVQDHLSVLGCTWGKCGQTFIALHRLM